jgi:hypothetical protein
METPNTPSLSGRLRENGVPRATIARMFRTFTAYAEAFRKESEAHERH